MEQILKELPKKAKEKYNEHKKFFAKIKKKTPKHLDNIMSELHDAEFEKNRLSYLRQLLLKPPALSSQKKISIEFLSILG